MTLCSCETTREKLEDFLRGELNDEETTMLLEHLDVCASCQAEQRVCEALTEAIQRGCREKAPAHLRDSILARVRT